MGPKGIPETSETQRNNPKDGKIQDPLTFFCTSRGYKVNNQNDEEMPIKVFIRQCTKASKIAYVRIMDACTWMTTEDQNT